MSSKTDKMIAKKINEIISKGNYDNEEFTNLRRTRYLDRKIIQIGFGISVIFGLFVLWAVRDAGKLWALGSMAVFMGVAFSLYASVVKTKRLYRIIDTYREALIDNNMREIKEIAKASDSNLNEFVDEFKELQDMCLFQQFSIDRTKMILVENEDWGLEGSGEYEKVHFTCSNCGAKNDIYNIKGSTSSKCEYCETSNSM